MVGAASVGSITTTISPTPAPPFGYPVLAYNTTAFRYEHDPDTLTDTTAALPKLTDAANAWSFPIAMSSDGAVTVVAGNSDGYPGGEIYLTDAANNVTATLASPNTGLAPRPLGGRTDDGAIVVTFSDQFTATPGQISGLGVPFFNRIPYVYNSHGWFLLGNILRTQGLDLEDLGWSPTDMAVTGVRTVDGVDLVFGQARRRTFNPDTGAFTNGAMEGFVIVLTTGVLARHAPAVNPPADDTLVGAWFLPFPSLASPGSASAYLSDGRYVQFTQGSGFYQKGFERGSYSWSGNGGEWYVNTRGDSNALFGLQNFSAILGRTLTVTGDTFRIANTHCTPGSTTIGCAGVDALRVPFDPDSIVGAWTGTVAGSVGGEFDGTIVTGVFLGPEQGLRYFVSYEVKRFGVVSPDEVEFGTYTYDLSTRTMTSIAEGAPDEDIDTVTLSPDGLAVRIEDHDPEGTVPVFNLTRIVPPSTVVRVIANTPLSASGRVGQPFNFVIQATHTATFGATGLPDGLAINSSSGVIGGIPTVGGQFAVTITASNSLGASDIETLTLTIKIPTPVGTNVVVEPEVSGAPGPGTSLTFGEITAEGTTTVTVIDDLGQIGVPPPGDGNVAIAGVVYEVTTTAEYQGLITLCFSYAGIDFGTATPQLFHYENNAWVDITFPDGPDEDTLPDGVHPDTETVCGATTTLSPFAILVSNVVRKGFYSPVNPIAGVLNTVKGGSTVPLKFNVFVDGVNQTTTAGLMPMTVQMVSCDSSAPQDPVDFTVTGETSLRYDAAAGYFIQNWKVQKTPGCYMVRMTTTQDGLALTARFKVR